MAAAAVEEVAGARARARHLSSLQTGHKVASAREVGATEAGDLVLRAGEVGDPQAQAVVATISVAGAVAGARTRCHRKQT